VTLDPAEEARLDQLYAKFAELVERTAPIVARYHAVLVEQGLDSEEATELARAFQDKLLE
jgi:hypothetical protein